MNTYGTLEEIREYLSLASQDDVDDNALKRFLRSSSRAIDRYCFRVFYPERKTLRYDIPEHYPDVLRFNTDVLAVNGLSHLNGTEEISSEVYWLKSGDDWNLTPYDRLELSESAGSVFNYSGTPQRAIHVDVTTGYHEDYNNTAWILTNSSLTNGTTVGASYIYVTGSNLADEWGDASGIKTFSTLRIGTEYLFVLSGVNASTLHVKRAMNGTSASAHAASTAVYVYKPEEDIRFGCIELAGFQYLSSISPRTGRQVIPTFGAAFTIDIPDSWPPQTQERLRRYRKLRVKHF